MLYLILHEPTDAYTAGCGQSDDVGAKGEVVHMDFNLLSADLLAVDQGAADGVDLNPVDKLGCLDGQFVLGRVGVEGDGGG